VTPAKGKKTKGPEEESDNASEGGKRASPTRNAKDRAKKSETELKEKISNKKFGKHLPKKKTEKQSRRENSEEQSLKTGKQIPKETKKQNRKEKSEKQSPQRKSGKQIPKESSERKGTAERAKGSKPKIGEPTKEEREGGSLASAKSEQRVMKPRSEDGGEPRTPARKRNEELGLGKATSLRRTGGEETQSPEAKDPRRRSTPGKAATGDKDEKNGTGQGPKDRYIANVAKFANQALTRGTRIRHANVEKMWNECGNVENVLGEIEKRRQERAWKWSTTKTKIGEVFGYLKAKGMEDEKRNRQLLDYEKFVANKVLEEEIDYPTPISKTQFFSILLRFRQKSKSSFREKEALLALTLMWMTTARPGCVLALMSRNVVLDKNGVSVLFVSGKGVRMRGRPNVVHTVLPSLGRGLLKKVLGKKQTQLFPENERGSIRREMRRLLKEENPLLELRSLRRGSLEEMAKNGVSQAILMEFSGHKRPETLMRYLRWGMASDPSVMRKAAKLLV
jgi:Phage integrase family